jgi:hypothetical protein
MKIQDLAAAAEQWGNAPDATSDVALETQAPETTALPAANAEGVVLPTDTASASAPVTPSAPADTAPATPEQTAELIKAMLGETEQPLRADLLIPLDDKGNMVPLAELRQNGLRQADYTRKTQALAEQRRQIEQQARDLQLASATIEVMRKEQEEQQERLLKSQQDPEEYERYLRHITLMQSDPEYRGVWEQAQRGKIRDAQEAAEAQLSEVEQRQAITDDIARTAEEFAALPEFAGIDIAEAVSVYGNRLSRGEATLRESDLRRAFEDLAARRVQIMSPLEKTVAELQATIATLQAEQAAAQTNQDLRSRIPSRTTPAPVPPAAPNRANPVVPSTPPRRRSMDLGQAAAAWAAGT